MFFDCVELNAFSFLQLQTVDANYCVSNNRGIDFSSCTRLIADDKTVAARAASLAAAAPAEVSFNTEIFWIAARALNVGWRPAAVYYNAICGTLHEREQTLQRIERVVEVAQSMGDRLPQEILRDMKVSN